VAGPALGLAVTTMNPYKIDEFRLNSYTSPAFVSAILGIVSLFLVALFVRDYSKTSLRTDAVYEILTKDDDLSVEEEEHIPLISGAATPKNRSSIRGDSSISSLMHSRSDALKGLAVISKLSSHQSVKRALPILLVLMFTNFAVATSSSIFMTLLTPVMQTDYNWGIREACYHWIWIGLISIISFCIHMKVKDSILKDNLAMGLGILFMASGWAIFIVGSPDAHLPIPRFIAGMSLLAIGLPWAIASCYSVFSKVLGNVEQGMLFGVLTAMGSLANLVSPIWASLLYDSSHGMILFPIVSGILVLANILNLAAYRMSKYLIWLNTVKIDYS